MRVAQIQGLRALAADTPRPLRDIPSCLASTDSTRCDCTEKSSVKASHISVPMARHLLPELEAALAKNGLFA